MERRVNTTKTEVPNLDIYLSFFGETLACYINCKIISSVTFCGEGRGALLDSVKLQQQAVQLRQVVAQR